MHTQHRYDQDSLRASRILKALLERGRRRAGNARHGRAQETAVERLGEDDVDEPDSGTLHEGRRDDRPRAGLEAGVAERSGVRHADADVLHQPRRPRLVEDAARRARTCEAPALATPPSGPRAGSHPLMRSCVRERPRDGCRILSLGQACSVTSQAKEGAGLTSRIVVRLGASAALASALHGCVSWRYATWHRKRTNPRPSRASLATESTNTSTPRWRTCTTTITYRITTGPDRSAASSIIARITTSTITITPRSTTHTRSATRSQSSANTTKWRTFTTTTSRSDDGDMSPRRSTPPSERSGGSKRIRRGSASPGASKSGSRAKAPTRRKGNARSGSRGRVRTGMSTPIERELP